MPVHDWTRVIVDVFHSFHLGWLSHLSGELNNGGLPDGFYALNEQHRALPVREVLDQVSYSQKLNDVIANSFVEGDDDAARFATYRMKRRTTTIRKASDHRAVAMVELVTPVNKDNSQSLDEFAARMQSAIGLGIHLLVIDLFPLGPFDPLGMHDVVWQRIDPGPIWSPPAKDCCLASYRAGSPSEAYVDWIDHGENLPTMPLFLSRNTSVDTPLDSSYARAFRGMPEFVRDILEGRSPPERD